MLIRIPSKFDSRKRFFGLQVHPKSGDDIGDLFFEVGFPVGFRDFFQVFFEGFLFGFKVLQVGSNGC